MFLRIVKKSILGNPIQKLLSFATIFLACLLLVCMLNITLGVGNQLGKELRNYGANISVLPQGSSYSIEVGNKSFKLQSESKFLNLDDLRKIKDIFWSNNITAIAPFKQRQVEFQGKKISILGTYFNKELVIEQDKFGNKTVVFDTGFLSLLPFLKTDLNFVNDNSLENEVNISEKLANSLNLKANDTFKVLINDKEVELKVVGIVSNLGDYEDKILINIDRLNDILNEPNTYERAEVSALTIPENDIAHRARYDIKSLNQVEFDNWYCTAFVSSIAYQIEENYKGASAKAVSKVADAESSIVKKIQGLMGIIFIISLIVASIAEASLINSDVYRRKKEIGLFKALGASNLQVYLVFAIDYLFVSLIASIFGAVFGFFVSDIISYSIFSHSIEYNFIIIFICMFFASLVALLGSLIATKNFVNLEIVEVLYERK